MKALTGLLIGLTLLVGQPSGLLGAEIAGEQPIASVREFSESFRMGYASGITAAASAVGIQCVQPRTGGELAGYFMWTADPAQSVIDTLREDWRQRGCTVANTSPNPKAAWFDPLYLIRTTTNVELLRKATGLAGTTEIQTLIRVLAGDRLMELEMLQREAKPRH